MSTPNRRLEDHDRLLDAADVLIKATEERPGGVSLVDVWTGDESLAPRDAFTPEEFVEAMLFLCRLGVTECTTPHSTSPRKGYW